MLHLWKLRYFDKSDEIAKAEVVYVYCFEKEIEVVKKVLLKELRDVNNNPMLRWGPHKPERVD